MTGRPITWTISSGLGSIAIGLCVLIAALPSCSQATPGEGDVESRSDHANKLVGVDAGDSILSAGLVGSPHDFTQQGDASLDLCTPCHTPHLPLPRGGADKGGGRILPYQSEGVALDSASLLCLSCHDGVIAPDVYTASHATQFAAQFGASKLGAGLLSGHPVGIEYPANDSTYRPIAAVESAGAIRLPGGRVQCISCHDPHNTGRHDGMLVRPNGGSRLCLSCHRL